MSTQGEIFLAFERDHDGPARGDDGPPRLETAVAYDIAAEIDERNGWTEGDEGPTADDHATAIKLAAHVFSEFLLFCLDGIAVDSRGRGMKRIAQRFVSVAAAISSDAIRGPAVAEKGRKKPARFAVGPVLNLAQIGKQPQIKLSPQQLRKLANQFLSRVGLQAK